MQACGNTSLSLKCSSDLQFLLGKLKFVVSVKTMPMRLRKEATCLEHLYTWFWGLIWGLANRVL